MKEYWRSLIRILSPVALAYTGLALVAFFGSEQLIFQPHPSSYKDTPAILKLPTSDGGAISAIHLRNERAHFTVLYSHGNGEDIGDDLPRLSAYQARGFSILAFDYQGYGTSTGKPSEHNAYEDIGTAYDYLTRKLGIPSSQIIVHGQSLGGAVAIDLAARKPVAGLIAESTFLTAFRVRTRWPMVPFDRFRSVDKIPNVNCPVLVIHGARDSVIPFRHGRELFKRAPDPKFSLWLEDAGHNNVIAVAGEKYWEAITSFAQLLQSDAPRGELDSALGGRSSRQ
jgi:pimeloyl-ACP methyl ester carboxylesterase